VEKVKEWGENFGYEIWEVEVDAVEQYSWGSGGLPQGNYVLEAPRLNFRYFYWYWSTSLQFLK